jgi:hypothetical protein
MTSLVQLANDKNAVEFKAALDEKIQEKVDAAIAEQKILVAGSLLDEAGVSGGVKKVWKKPTIKGKPTLPAKGMRESFTSAELASLDEKVIQAGSIEHMAHAVHACATGNCPTASSRGTFTQFDHPDYSIHRDNGSINPDAHEMNYHVLGAGGHHKFTVANTKNGLDVKHVGHLG